MPTFPLSQLDARAGELHLGIGHPYDDILPHSQLKDAASNLFAESSRDYLVYGADAGSPKLRHALADFLSRHNAQAVLVEELMISGGISQMLDMLCASLCQRGDTIVVEEPTYFLALDIFRDYGLNIVSVPMDDEGLDVAALEQLLQNQKIRLLYTIPVHQNPSGICLSAERRARIVALAEQHDFLILADEAYHLLGYDDAARAIPSMGDYAQSRRVFALGSFSKILVPGLRLGWVQAHPDWLEKLTKRGMIQSGGGFQPFTAAVVHQLIVEGAQDAYLSFLRQHYQQSVDAMDEALASLHALGLDYRKPEGGYFFWLELPSQITAEALLPVAMEANVNFQMGQRFSARGNLQNYIRVCFAHYPAEKLQEAVQRLEQSLQHFL